MRSLSKLIVAFALTLPLMTSGMAQGYGTQHSTHHMYRSMNAKQHELYSTMRKLWEDHITWTRLFIVSAAADSPDKQATTNRLLQNQVDIGNAIKPFYGNGAGDKLTALLKDHILIAADIVTSAKAKNMAAVGSAKTRWFSNADQIADFLSGANPRNWPKSDMRQMMHDHLNLTLDEAVAQLQGDYRTSVAKYDQVHVQILNMADMLSEGIASQFPNKLR
jgi:hypothetical protein